MIPSVVLVFERQWCCGLVRLEVVEDQEVTYARKCRGRKPHRWLIERTKRASKEGDMKNKSIESCLYDFPRKFWFWF
jgi:hypothetical protein